MDDPYQLGMFDDSVYLTRIDDEKRMRRFYKIYVQSDLFGGAQLVREWGRIGSPGTVATTLFASEGAAVDALDALARKKQRRGYT